MVEHVLEAEHLRKTFRGLTAVADVSFGVRRGECFGILGPNGAGKTTTIRMVYGFSPRDGGLLRVFGREVPGELRDVKARLGVCQQENTLDPDLTVAQNLEVFARYFDIPRSQAKNRAAELLGFIALDHRRGATVSELSGGMMRRLMLARALVNNPEMVILDEPTTGLDPQSRHQVWDRLEKLKEQGLSILLTTHYMDEASRLCDRLVIMDQGRILVEGEPLSLIRRYVGREVLEISNANPEIRALLKSRGLDHEDLGHRLIVYGGDGAEIYRQVTDSYCKEGCVLRMATLEDVFLRLTGRELRE